MKYLKTLLWFFVEQFFGIYFRIFGKPILDATMKKTLRLYEESKFFELFSLIRAWDAPFKQINSLLPKSGMILDIGCGDGTQTNYLALSSSKRTLLGIELNKDRVSEAYKGLKNTTFKQGNALTARLPKADAIVITHVLHHLPTRDDQITLLRKLKKSLKPRGVLVIVEIIEKPFLKYLFTWLTDAFTVPILFEKKLYDFNFHYRTDSEWKDVLEELGFSYTRKVVHKGMPFSHCIYTCRYPSNV